MNIDVLGVARRVVPCCPPALAGGLNRPGAERLAARFRALGDPARVLLLSFLARQDSGEACVCHLTDLLGRSQSTVSHHLKKLADAGLVTCERRGTWAYYRVAREGLQAMRDALGTAEAEAAGGDERAPVRGSAR